MTTDLLIPPTAVPLAAVVPSVRKVSECDDPTGDTLDDPGRLIIDRPRETIGFIVCDRESFDLVEDPGRVNVPYPRTTVMAHVVQLGRRSPQVSEVEDD